MKFTEISDRLRYPAKVKGKLSTQHAGIIEYTIQYYEDTKAFKQRVILTMNILSVCMLTGDSMPMEWSESHPFENLPNFEDTYLRSVLKDLYIDFKSVVWDVNTASSPSTVSAEISSSRFVPVQKIVADDPSLVSTRKFTSPEDLSLYGPEIPVFDTTQVFASGTFFDKPYCVYYSLPLIPTRQCEISATTDVDACQECHLLMLYPTSRFYTRHDGLYSPIDGLSFDKLLGVIPRINGFTEEQIRDNIVRYPHLDVLHRMGFKNGVKTLVDFWRRIEIDGKLYKTLEIWDELPDTKGLPKNAGLVSEYVVRRYLLERDINHVNHRYKMYGSLDPFLTLFLPTTDYINLGYTNVVDIARQCVNSRVAFKRSRNPILRRLEEQHE